MKLKNIAVFALTLALVATSAKSQTFKADYATKLTLAGNNGADPINTLTFSVLGDPASPLTLKFPNNNGSGGSNYYLQNDGLGGLTWVNAATPTLTLASGDIFFGIGGVATAAAVTQDVTLTNVAGAAQAQVNGSHAATFAATGAITAGGNISTATGTVSGATGTFTNLSGTTMTGALAMGSNNITGAGTITGTTITGTSVSAGAGTISTTGAIDGNTGVFTSTLSADGLTSTGGLTTSGGTANINATGNNPVNIGILNSGAGGTITVGDNAGPSITDLNGTVNFGGTVSFPSGSVSLGSLNVTTGDIVMGVGGVAAGVALTGDISIPTSGATTVNSVQTAAGPTIATAINNNVANAINGNNIKIDATLQVGAGGANKLGVDLTHANTWTGEQTLSGTGTGLNVTTGATFSGSVGVTGQTTLGSTGLSNVTLAAPASGALALGSASSYYILTDGGSAKTYTSITGANAAAGQVIVIVNASTTQADYITLTNGAGMALNGSPVIIGDGGAVTLLYDATAGWRLIGAE